MRIATAPALHLSNREVLDHFLSLKQDTDSLQSLITTRSARLTAKGRQDHPLKGDDVLEKVEVGEETPEEETAVRRGVSDESVWVQDQVLHYLSGEHIRTAYQTDEGVARLANELQDHSLAKGEVLQICNLVPQTLVELYCIIEEADHRFHPNANQQLQEIVDQVQSTRLETFPPELEQFVTASSLGQLDENLHPEHVTQAVPAGMEEEFVHEAEWGPGREEGIGEEKEEEME